MADFYLHPTDGSFFKMVKYQIRAIIKSEGEDRDLEVW